MAGIDKSRFLPGDNVEVHFNATNFVKGQLIRLRDNGDVILSVAGVKHYCREFWYLTESATP
jgi:hypothetical protein